MDRREKEAGGMSSMKRASSDSTFPAGRKEDVKQKNDLLRKFWKIPAWQVETSVVLTDAETYTRRNCT